jgi:hypothetical protein
VVSTDRLEAFVGQAVTDMGAAIIATLQPGDPRATDPRAR